MKKSNAPGEESQLHEVELVLALQKEAQEQLAGIFKSLMGEAQQKELHEVERQVFAKLLCLGRTLLEVFLAEKGTGKTENPIVRDGTELRYHSTKSCVYLSVFGRVDIKRAYYWAGGQEGYFPLDEELNLPETRYSYFLQEWGELIGVGQAFDRVTEQLERWLGIKFWKQGVQKVAGEAGRDVQPFYEQKGAPCREEEGSILVAAIDGKGVPVRKQESSEEKLRLGRGERANKKKEAVVSAVYTIDQHRRKPQDILKEIDRTGVVVKSEGTEPPCPKNKRVRATLGGKDAALQEVLRQMEERDPDHRKDWVGLADGSTGLQRKAEQYLGGRENFTLILDLFHVLEYLWEASYAFHKEGSVEAARWVMNKLRLLLEGKVGYVIGALKRSIKKYGLSGQRRAKVRKAMKYFARNRAYMAYDLYLKRGYPIGTGVVEGACRNLVRDRMEGAGMRWSISGAQAVLELRAVQINGDWEAFWKYHIAKEKERIYGKGNDQARPQISRKNAA